MAACFATQKIKDASRWASYLALQLQGQNGLEIENEANVYQQLNGFFFILHSLHSVSVFQVARVALIVVTFSSRLEENEYCVRGKLCSLCVFCMCLFLTFFFLLSFTDKRADALRLLLLYNRLSLAIRNYVNTI